MNVFAQTQPFTRLRAQQGRSHLGFERGWDSAEWSPEEPLGGFVGRSLFFEVGSRGMRDEMNDWRPLSDCSFTVCPGYSWTKKMKSLIWKRSGPRVSNDQTLSDWRCQIRLMFILYLRWSPTTQNSVSRRIGSCQPSFSSSMVAGLDHPAEAVLVARTARRPSRLGRRSRRHQEVPRMCHRMAAMTWMTMLRRWFCMMRFFF